MHQQTQFEVLPFSRNCVSESPPLCVNYPQSRPENALLYDIQSVAPENAWHFTNPSEYVPEKDNGKPQFDFREYSAEIIESYKKRCEIKLEQLYRYRLTMQLPFPKNIDKYQHKRRYPELWLEDMISASQGPDIE